METVKAYTLHEEHTQWLNKLSFYADDLTLLQRRLEEIVGKNNAPEFLATAEHFQNQFIMRKEQIDELRHAIKDHETYVEGKVGNNPAAHGVTLNDHGKEREDVEGFETAFNTMRRDFVEFAGKYM
jgi:hypothetical protein